MLFQQKQVPLKTTHPRLGGAGRDRNGFGRAGQARPAGWALRKGVLFYKI